MKHNDQGQKSRFIRCYLSLAICSVMSQAYALQAMNDSDLRAVDGQDGLQLQINYETAKIDQLTWQDQARQVDGSAGKNLNMTMNNVNITRGALPSTDKLGVQLKADIYSTAAATPGLNLNVQATLGKLTAEQWMLCADTSCRATNASLGALSLEAYNPIQVNLLTTQGLFNRDRQATLDLAIRDAVIGLAQKDQNGQSNRLALQNFNLNLHSSGYIYVDPQAGLTLKTAPDGYVDFIANDLSGRPGVNLELALNERGLIRAGMSGRLYDGLIQIGAGNHAVDLLGTNQQASNSNAAATTGLKLKVEGLLSNDLDRLGNKAATLELGAAGHYAYGLRFENLTALRTRSNVGENQRGDLPLGTERAGIGMEGIYFNLVDSRSIQLPEHLTLNRTFLGTNSGPLAVKMTNAMDYQQLLADSSLNTYSAVLALRQVDLQAMSRRGRFIASPDITVAGTLPSSEPSKWGLGTPIHNLNANLAIYAKKADGTRDYIVEKDQNDVATLKAVSGSERLGFSAALSTQGVSSDGSKTTSILLIDGSDNRNYANGMVTPIDNYIGIRNIDMLFNGYGSIGLENGQVNVSMPDLRLVVAAQLAAGYLPGAKYQTCPSVGGCYAPSNSFTSNKDVLAGVKLRLAGAMNFALVPRGLDPDPSVGQYAASQLGFIGVLNLNANSYMNNAIQLVDADGSTLGLDNLSGQLTFDNRLLVNKDSIGVNTNLVFNPNKTPDAVLRAKDINLYPASVVEGKTMLGNPQRLGEFAITGGRLETQISIRPRDGAFKF